MSVRVKQGKRERGKEGEREKGKEGKLNTDIMSQGECQAIWIISMDVAGKRRAQDA